MEALVQQRWVTHRSGHSGDNKATSVPATATSIPIDVIAGRPLTGNGDHRPVRRPLGYS